MEPKTISDSSGNTVNGQHNLAVAAEGAEQKTGHKSIDPDAVCRVAAQLAGEIDPHRSADLQVELDHSLERDLGFDSLAKVELLSRLEKAYGVTVREEVLTAAETLRDLIRALEQGAARGKLSVDRQPMASSQEGELRAATADTAQTLGEMLHLQTARAPDQVHLLLYATEDEPIAVSHRQLLDQATAVATGLLALDLQPGSSIALMLPTGLDYFFSFFGVLLAGCVPVPLYPPIRPSQFEDHLLRHRHILNNCQARLLITVTEARPLARFLKAQVNSLRRIVTVEELRTPNSIPTLPQAMPEDTAFLQYTSGSTGIPKGVILSHTNLLTNIRFMGRATGACAEDVFVSWLPLYHDMGLIGAWLGSLYHGCQLVIMSPLSFLVHPDRWLWAIHRHRGTLAASPNFGYELCLNKIDDDQLTGLDLSSWRLAFNGAEPVSPETVTRFTRRFGAYGLRPEAMAPVYGLAESSVGLAFPPVSRGPLIDRVQRQPLMQTGKAVPADADDPGPLRFVSCGRVLAEHQIRVVDGNDHELPDRQVGHLQFQGPSATSGYFRNPEQTKNLFHGPWLDTGDLAYLAGQDLFLTSRVKDIIIRGGRNISPYELEEAIGELEGIRKGCVAVFGTTDEASGTEKVVVLAESRSRDAQVLADLRKRVVNRAVDILGMPPDEVILAPPRTVLKTSSGKIRRAASREMYEQGRIGRPPRAVWWQIARLAWSSLLQQGAQSLRLAASTGYAGYCWLLFGLITVAAIPAAVLLPSGAGSWQVARIAARLLARLTATRIVVHGLEHLDTTDPMILVANHQSYMDSLILMAALPLRFSYVAKAELARNAVMRHLLQRLDVVFVERFDSTQALADTRRLKELAAGGRSLCFFAEGTIRRMPGLLPFHMGAFLIAAENTMVVVPITIRGTRAKLRSESWFPRPGQVHLFIGPRLPVQGSGWDAALALRNEARRHILLHCGEPDLGTDA
jgi:1-acyl-sn-glycerol-3-phosphate acyltransferase